jgi:hypothetical protein
MDGSETEAAREVVITAICQSGMTTTLSFRTHVPTDVTLTVVGVDKNQIRPIAGWMFETNSTCTQLRYQEARVIATASFSSGQARLFTGVDVTDVITLTSSADEVLTVDTSAAAASGGEILLHAITPGDTTLRVHATTGALMASLVVEVMDYSRANQLAVVGIDVHAVNTLGSVTYTNAPSTTELMVPRGKVIQVTVSPPTVIQLQYEGDSMAIIVWAILEDHSRIELLPSNGLQVTSLHSMALTVTVNKDQDLVHVVVPAEPTAHTEGPLLRVQWLLDGACTSASNSIQSTRDLALTVIPPPAESIKVSVPATLLVCNNDVATGAGADYPSTVQLTATLHFVDTTGDRQLDHQRTITTDHRTSYEVTEDAPFTVNINGTAIANTDGVIGTGTITVHFVGQSVTGTVTLEVTKFAALEVFAVAEPSYAGSTAEGVYQLSSIECTEPNLYEQARMQVTMVLANANTKVIGAQHTTLRTASAVSGVDKGVLVLDGRVVRAAQNGSGYVYATFNGIESTKPWLLKVVDPAVGDAAANTIVTLTSIDNLQMISTTHGRTMSAMVGEAGTTGIATLTFGGTFSNGREYPTIVDKDGINVLPGAVTFSSLVPDKLSVDAVSGALTLLGNHYETVTVQATSSCTPISATVEVACNLQPVSVGDVDLGGTRVPIEAKVVGDSFTLPVKVNTGGKNLAAFNIRIQFDPLVLKPDLSLVKHTIMSIQGATELKASISVVGDEILLAAVIQKSQVKGWQSGVTIAKVGFKAIGAGVTIVTGITVQLLDDTPDQPQQIGTANSPFVAGEIPILITNAERMRKDERTDGSAGEITAAASMSTVAVKSSQQRVLHALKAAIVDLDLDLDINHPYKERRDKRRSSFPSVMTSGSLARADANCDGKLSLEDPIRINDYIAARNGAFQTSMGIQISASTAKCRIKLGLTKTDDSFLDPDGNQVVEGIDATYLLDVMVQNFYFYDVETAIATAPACGLAVYVRLSNEMGAPPRIGTRLLLDFGFDSAETLGLLSPTLLTTANVLTFDKGSVELHGALVEGEAFSGTDDGLFVFTLPIPNVDVSAGTLGISLIQITSPEMVVFPRCKFFAGPEAEPVFGGALSYDGAMWQSDVGVKRGTGYNPLIEDVPMAEASCLTPPTSTRTRTSTSATMPSTITKSTTGENTTVSSKAVADRSTTVAPTRTITVEFGTTTPDWDDVSYPASTVTTTKDPLPVTRTTTTKGLPVKVTFVIYTDCALVDLHELRIQTAVSLIDSGIVSLSDFKGVKATCGSARVVVTVLVRNPGAAAAITEALQDGYASCFFFFCRFSFEGFNLIPHLLSR